MADAQLDQQQLQQLTALQSVPPDTLERCRRTGTGEDWIRPAVFSLRRPLASAVGSPATDDQCRPARSLPEALRAELRRSDPAVLREQQSQWQFNVNQVAELMVDTADQVVDLVPISKPLGVKVASPQPVLAEGQPCCRRPTV